MQNDGDGWYSYTINGAACVNMVFNNNASPQTTNLSRCGDGWYDDNTKTWTSQKPSSARVASTADARKHESPEKVTLGQNRPNPFDQTTTISFALPETQPVVLKVYDVYGKEVSVLADGIREKGTHNVVFQTKGLAPGMYMYRLSAGHEVLTRKLIKN
jgi:hypothetical protein